ncbi:MAG: nucleoside 2-deoxyribosyltransferase [Tissierellia bacterium]|nr:nucleoside 2-deoxyribosyltransferase [Tissierellia bacterium]
MKAYLASHFFNDAFFRWTEDFAQYLEENTDLELYVPQRNDRINDKKNNDDQITDIAIAKADTEALKESNILIACIDGLTIDDGVAGEIMGHAIMKEMEEEYNIPGIPRTIIGIITDMRWLGTGENKLYRNQMILGKIKEQGHFVVGYAGKEDWKEEVLEIIEEFTKKHGN